MKKEWKNIVITQISVAVYVAPNSGRHIHENRPFHGFVLNDADAIRDYCFSDGRVMRTEGGAFFYLPKGSSYVVKSIKSGGCYAINFDAEIKDDPFCIKLKNYESLKKNFKTVCNEWRMHDSTRHAAAMCALYDAVYLAQKEQEQSYMPNDRHRLIMPAVEAIEHNFTDQGLTVASLAELCGVSEVYFRKIFIHSFGISPKECIIRKRMEYAKHLLSSGQVGVAETAQMCGYAEPCHFSREFLKRVGVTPGQYASK